MFLNLIPVSITHTWSKSGCILQFPDVCILVYFIRVKEVKKKSSYSFGLKKSGEVTGMKWILRYGKSKFWATINVDLGL